MAVNIPNPGSYTQALGLHAITFRDALQALLNDAAYMNEMGKPFLMAAYPDGLGMSDADATRVLATIGAVTPDNATVIAVRTFIESTEFLWGGG